MLETALPRKNYQIFSLQGRCNTKLNYLKLIAINLTVQLLLLNINKWSLKVLISDLLLFVFQFHIPFAKLWIWEHAVFTLLRRLKCPLNLFSEQQKVWIFWSENFGLLGIKSVHGRPDSSSWCTDSWPYIVPPKVEPHCQLPSLLVHWFYQERNTHAMPLQCGGVRRLKHGKSDLQIIALIPRIDFYFKGYLHCKTIFCHKVALDAQLMNFFIWNKNNISFSRYLDFRVFVKSTDFKICDVIISIAG